MRLNSTRIDYFEPGNISGQKKNYRDFIGPEKQKSSICLFFADPRIEDSGL